MRNHLSVGEKAYLRTDVDIAQYQYHLNGVSYKRVMAGLIKGLPVIIVSRIPFAKLNPQYEHHFKDCDFVFEVEISPIDFKYDRKSSVYLPDWMLRNDEVISLMHRCTYPVTERMM
jgi:hypothetical protein